MRRLALIFAFAASAVVAVAEPASADAPEVISVELEGAEDVTVGDPLTYRAAIAHDPGTTIVFTPGASLGAVDIIDGGETSTASADGRSVTTITYTLAAFETGSLVVGPLPYRVLGPDSSDLGEFEAAAVALTVLPTLGSEQQVLTLRDIRPQFEVPVTTASTVRPYVYAAIAVVVVTLLALWLLLYLRTRPRKVVIERRLSPEDQAAADLSALARSGLLEGDPSDNYCRLSRAVRTYLAARYEFPALSCSTREVEREMLNRGLDRWQARLVSGLLSECDDVVFAGYQPAQARADSDLTLAFQVIEMTERPQSAAAAVPASGG